MSHPLLQNQNLSKSEVVEIQKGDQVIIAAEGLDLSQDITANLKQRQQVPRSKTEDSRKSISSQILKFTNQISKDLYDPFSTHEEDIINKHGHDEFEFQFLEDEQESDSIGSQINSDENEYLTEEDIRLLRTPLYRKFLCCVCGP